MNVLIALTCASCGSAALVRPPFGVRLGELPGHRFWPDSTPLAAAGPFASLAFVGHRQTTDACLLALAQANGGQLVTLDPGIKDLIARRGERARWVTCIDLG